MASDYPFGIFKLLLWYFWLCCIWGHKCN